MLIAIEGPDGAGKTTRVRELQQRLPNARVIHFGPPKEWPLLEIERALQDYKPGSGEHIICDRLHVGEMIYGPIYRGSTQLEGTALTHLNQFLRSRGALMVYLDAPDDVLIERVTFRGDGYINTKDLPQIAAEYRKRMHEEELCYARNASARFSVMVGEQLEAETRKLAKFTSYVGPPAPTVLLVGDKPSGMAQGLKQAFVPWPGKSGDALMFAARRAFYTRWGVLNQSEDDVAKAVEALDPTAVVALGANALKACMRAGLPCGSAPHPAVAARWGVDKTKYAEALVKAANYQHVTLKEMANA